MPHNWLAQGLIFSVVVYVLLAVCIVARGRLTRHRIRKVAERLRRETNGDRRVL